MQTLSKHRGLSTIPLIWAQVFMQTNVQKLIFSAEKDLLKLQTEACAKGHPGPQEVISQIRKTTTRVN